MQYRPEIDGLRAVAVVPVVLFHAGLGPFQGGYIGVDIFFVISGYLITSILLSDLEKGRFSILTFYERRARRILPALYLVMLASILPAWLWMFPLQFNAFSQSIVATTLFSSNILFWLKSGYFAPVAELKPLLHTWSLAVEEQFYVFFPLLLFGLWHFSRRALPAIFAGLIIATFLLCLMGARSWPEGNFYLLPSRTWELLTGAVCAIVLSHREVRPNWFAGAAGGVMLGSALILVNRSTPWPSAMTLLPVTGTALIILFCHTGNGFGRLLSLRPVVFIGLISYSTYLWHQPILTFARLRSLTPPSPLLMATLVAVTFLLAALTWRFIERPFRSRRDGRYTIPGQAILVSSVAGAVVLVASGLAGDATDGFPGRIAPSGRSFAAIEAGLATLGANENILGCDTDISFKPVPQMPPADCTFDPASAASRRAIVIGDSHATVMSRQLRDLLTGHGYTTTITTFGGCMPFPGYDLPGRNCDAANRAVYDYIEKTPPDLIVLAFHPEVLLNGPLAARQDRAAQTLATPIFTRDARNRFPPHASTAQKVLALVGNGMKTLLDTGATVAVFYPVPEARLDVGAYMRKAHAFTTSARELRVTTPYSDYIQRSGPVIDLLDRVEHPNLVRIRPAADLCDPQAGVCHATLGDQILYIDDNHLSRDGIALVLKAFSRVIGALPQALQLRPIESYSANPAARTISPE